MSKEYRISSAIGKHRLPHFEGGGVGFGQAHYSWSINAKLYLDGLREIREVESIDAPDIYQDRIAQAVARLKSDVIHLVDKPIEFLRPMFDRYNVSVMVWEFEEFSNTSVKGNPTLNQIHMLRQMDDIWCGSSFTQRSLAAYGVKARFLPPPVAHFITSQMASIDNIPYVPLNTEKFVVESPDPLGDVIASLGEKILFLTILAPYDLRKNFKALIEGFRDSEASKTSILLVKLVIDNVHTTVGNINEIAKVHYGIDIQSDNILFIGDYLTDAQLNKLYSITSFYVTASSAEGLNLPLIESMGRGLPALSINRTAMEDYVNDENAIVISSSRVLTKGNMHALSGSLKTTHYPPTKKAMSQAFDRAARMTRNDREAMGAKGADTVHKIYGLDEFMARIEEFESSVS
jgi:hypothetical protein